ncbi:MAG: cellulase family glycosylhydrolase [Solirubrobacterales bacterium]|nr:cellulase family glycosylhydrolase [Solirubrobacterales bacterium]
MPLLIAVVPVQPASAGSSPAVVQYEYQPIPTGGDGPGPPPGQGSTGSELDGSGIPLLLIAAVVLVLAGFGLAAWIGRRRRGKRFELPRATVPLALAGAVLIAILAFGASGTTAAPGVKAPRDFLGIAPQQGFTATDTSKMTSGGIGAIRVPVSWEQVQPDGPGSFDWGLLDEAVRAGAVHNLPVLPVLYATPGWVANRTTTLPSTPRQMSAWRDFVAAAVQRYGEGGTFWDDPFWDEPAQEFSVKPPIVVWQIWNEVNFHYFAKPVSAKRYAKVLKAASNVIRANDSGAEVMVSGLFGRPKGPKKKAVAAPAFIKQLGRYVPPKYIDSIALHPYSPNTPALKKLIADYRKAANRAGYKRKPINVTEIGWGSGKPSSNAFLSGSQKKQAKQLTSALTFLIKSRKKYGIDSAFWYSWKDTDPNGQNCTFCYTIGLFEYGEGLTPKKAWRAFVRLTGGQP